MATLEQLQEQLDNRSLDPSTLSNKQKRIIDELISRGKLKGPTTSQLTEQRQEAAQDIAREEEFRRDPIATALAAEDSFFKGRPTAVFAGDITGSITPYLMMREKIYGAAKSGNLWKKGPGKMAQVAAGVADRLPGRLKLLGGAFKLPLLINSSIILLCLFERVDGSKDLLSNCSCNCSRVAIIY